MIIQADARALPLRTGSVQCVVTSPPYWGLRDYGTARWEGGDEGCEHLNGALCSDKSTLAGYTSENIKLRTNGIPYRDLCGKCGARRIDAQIGLEASPEAFVATMVEVFREVRRILKSDGTCWLNLGDSYAGAGHGLYKNGLSMGTGGPKQKTNAGSVGVLSLAKDYGKPKDLIGIPWRVAFALQADGWYLRSDIIWAKGNPMPESVQDRPTRSHEYVFLLAKSERYFYDAAAIMEPVSGTANGRGAGIHPKAFGVNSRVMQDRDPNHPSVRKTKQNESFSAAVRGLVEERNKRSVWTINSEPCAAAHFATFPQKLVEPCILAGSRPGDLVFDPFLGFGTVGIVAERFGRRWAGTDLSPTYLRDIAKHRTAQMGLRL